MRVLKAFLLAPVAPILIFVAVAIIAPALSGPQHPEALASLTILTLIGAFIVAYLLSFVIAAPLFLMLRRRWNPTFLICAVFGALIGALPIFAIEVQRVLSIREGSTFSARSGACDIIVDNVRTACGYVELFQQAAWFALIGAGAGAAFWFVYANPGRFGFRLIGATFAAIALGAGAFYAAAYDRSCHASYMRGRTSIAPTLAIEVSAPKEGVGDFVLLMREFASAQNMSFRDSSSLAHPSYRVLGVSVCREGLNFEINEHRLAEDSFEGKFGQGVGISIFVTDETVDHVTPTRDLVARLEKKWPNAVRFTGPLGEFVGKPDFLQEIDATQAVSQ